MYAQSFMAHDASGKLIAASSAQNPPEAHYTCHLCNSRLRFHHRASPPWFEHVETYLTDNGRQHCPYVHPDSAEIELIQMLRLSVPEIWPMIFKGDWHCTACGNDYHGEFYCITCRTGAHSITLRAEGAA